MTGSSFEPLASLESASFRLFSDGGPASSVETKGLQYARYTVSEPNGRIAIEDNVEELRYIATKPGMGKLLEVLWIISVAYRLVNCLLLPVPRSMTKRELPFVSSSAWIRTIREWANQIRKSMRAPLSLSPTHLSVRIY